MKIFTKNTSESRFTVILKLDDGYEVKVLHGLSIGKLAKAGKNMEDFVNYLNTEFFKEDRSDYNVSKIKDTFSKIKEDFYNQNGIEGFEEEEDLFSELFEEPFGDSQRRKGKKFVDEIEGNRNKIGEDKIEEIKNYVRNVSRFEEEFDPARPIIQDFNGLFVFEEGGKPFQECLNDNSVLITENRGTGSGYMTDIEFYFPNFEKAKGFMIDFFGMQASQEEDDFIEEIFICDSTKVKRKV